MQNAEPLSVLQAIQLILAPAVMISACGLLMLGISNRFSLVLNRLRSLNKEKRSLSTRSTERDFSLEENQRLASIAHQLDQLSERARLVRNTLFCYFAALGLFVLTSLLIGLEYLVPGLSMDGLIVACFLVGMGLVFAGIAFALFDTHRAYQVIRFDIASGE